MAKLQVNIDDEAQKIIDNLKSKQTKSFFTSLAIVYFSKSKDGKNFINLSKVDDTKENNKNKKNHFLQNDKIKLEGWN